MKMIAQHSETTTYWQGIIGTLVQRGLLTQRKDGRKVIPRSAVAIVTPEYVAFVLDMQRLAGIPREKWLDPQLWAQTRAALQGRRVFVADSAGLAMVVARNPESPQRQRLPTKLVMTPDLLPEGDYTVLLGRSTDGDVVLDVAEGERAILVGGTTGSGKTRTLVSLVLQLTSKFGPDELSLALVDLKRLDFPPLDGLPHLISPVATTEKEAVELVRWCVQEMQHRQTLMREALVTRWDRMPEGERFPLLLLVVDEIADFAKSSVMGDLVELARKSRASGIALIAATQRPDAQVLSRQVKANLSTRIAFRVTDHTESGIILDRTGAEKIKRVGLCLTNAGGQWRKVQTAYVPEEAVGDWLPPTPVNVPAPRLSDTERALVCYALDELGGAFTINRLYEAH
ncbi:MAG: FtsK/SpoIIIE domain-containing protein, partial [Chloroflexota bacterium]|nr:FtsK/SpoIIIE domain-containing protein [Chloroflexota bacterium]